MHSNTRITLVSNNNSNLVICIGPYYEEVPLLSRSYRGPV